MSKLHGTLESEKTGKTTRSSNLIMEATIESDEGALELLMNASGNVYLHVQDNYERRMVMATTLKELLCLVQQRGMIKV